MIPWLLRVLGYREYAVYELYDLLQTIDEPDARFILVWLSDGEEES